MMLIFSFLLVTFFSRDHRLSHVKLLSGEKKTVEQHVEHTIRVPNDNDHVHQKDLGRAIGTCNIGEVITGTR